MFFDDIKNIIDFRLRQIFPFSRKNYCIQNEPKNELFSCDEIKNRESELFEKYDLTFLKEHSTTQNYLENLYMLDLLGKYFEVENKQSASVLDIGCKNWFYVQGEFAFFSKFVSDLKLDGIELDTNRLYTNFYSRKETAKAHMNGLDNTSYIEGDFLEHNKKYDYMTWILPFVFERPHQKWGLPMNYFKPKEMLVHTYELLNNGGKIFIINQGIEEYIAQKELCNDLAISYADIGLIKSAFFDYKYDRYLIVITK